MLTYFHSFTSCSEPLRGVLCHTQSGKRAEQSLGWGELHREAGEVVRQTGNQGWTAKGQARWEDPPGKGGEAGSAARCEWGRGHM